jgi:hypothetical protein
MAAGIVVECRVTAGDWAVAAGVEAEVAGDGGRTTRPLQAVNAASAITAMRRIRIEEGRGRILPPII